MGLEGYYNSSRDVPCPRCGREKFCLIHESAGHGICTKVASPKRWGEAGWWYAIDGEIDLTHATRVDSSKLPPEEVYTIWRQTVRGSLHKVEELADELGVSCDALRRLGVGWSADFRAHTLPLRSHRGRVVGMQFRSGPHKWFLTGGRAGLFTPRGATQDSKAVVFFPEGASDTAALLTAGLTAVGRFNNRSGLKEIQAWIDRYPRWRRGIPSAVLVADSDKPGLDGAVDLAIAIPGSVVIAPVGVKDAREAMAAGCTAEDMMAAALGGESEFWRLTPVDRGSLV